MSGHQPKELTELAFASFTAYMKNEALQFMKWMKVRLPCTEIETKASGTCKKLKDVFHGTRLPTVLANEITKRLLTILDMFYKIFEYSRKDYFQQILLPVVEVFLHADVTSIELGSSSLYRSGYYYYNFIVTLILMKIGNLNNLKTLSLGFGINIHLKDMLILPSQLKELTLCGSLCSDKDSLKRIVECCQELKSLKILRCYLDDTSVPHLLKLNHLETLHLLGGGDYGLDEDCVELINGISTDVSNDVLSASTLKSFGIELRDENTLYLIVRKLPHLTEIVLQLENEFELSCLTQLKNLRSLSLDARDRASDDYKKILPVLGKSLVSLELRGYKGLDLEFIGETCSNLRCLHVFTAENFVSFETRPTLKTFPNFRTVECLKIGMFEDTDWMEFIIGQCVNIKVLIVVCGSEPTIMENVLKCTRLTNLEEIHWYGYVEERTAEDSCLEALCLRCPNLRLVHGLGSDSFISGRVVFDFNGCEKSFCETFRYILYTLDVPCFGLYFCDSSSDSDCDWIVVM